MFKPASVGTRICNTTYITGWKQHVLPQLNCHVWCEGVSRRWPRTDWLDVWQTGLCKDTVHVLTRRKQRFVILRPLKVLHNLLLHVVPHPQSLAKWDATFCLPTNISMSEMLTSLGRCSHLTCLQHHLQTINFVHTSAILHFLLFLWLISSSMFWISALSTLPLDDLYSSYSTVPPAGPWCSAPSTPPWWGCSRSLVMEDWGAGTSGRSSGSPGSWFWGREPPWCHEDTVCCLDRALQSLCLRMVHRQAEKYF